MTSRISRRSFLASATAASVASPFAASLLSAAGKKGPAGLELYSVRDELQKDLFGTVRGVAKMGYRNVEFFSPYFRWTADYAKKVRALLDDLGITCRSTHNGGESFTAEGLDKAIELNGTIGSQNIIWASAGQPSGLDGWKKVADTLNQAADKLKSARMRTGYHNHELEFKPVEGTRPIEVIAKNTVPDVTLQLDVGTCIEAGSDPVAWINQNPGRIRLMHCKDWSPDKGFKVLFGEGVAPWKKIFQAAEKAGGIEYYLIEQEGSRFPEMETAEKCLAAFKQTHG